MSMDQTKLVANLVINVTSIQESLKMVSDEVKALRDQMQQPIKENAFVQMSGSAMTVKQALRDLQLQMQEGTISLEDYVVKLKELQSTFSAMGSLDRTTSQGLLNDQAIRSSIVSAQAQLSKFQDFELQSERSLAQQQADIQAENVRNSQMATDNKVKQVKQFYDLDLMSAQDAFDQLNVIYEQDYERFAADIDKKTAILKQMYAYETQAAKDVAAQSDMAMAGGSGGSGGGLFANRSSSTSHTGFGLSPINMAGMMIEFQGMMGLFSNLQQGFTQIGQSAAQLQQVFGNQIQNQQQLTQTTDQFIGVAQQLGVNISDVTSAATLWARQYKDVNTVMALTHNSTLLAVDDSMSVTDANRAVESSLNTMGMAVGNASEAYASSIKLVDSWTSVSHSASVSAQDLTSGFERSAAAAHDAGLNVDQLNALVAAGVRNSGRTGQVIGNMWKSVLANISSGSPKVVDAFKALGISMTEVGQNGQTQIKPVWDLINELASATQNATVADAKYFEAISGGKYQYDSLRAALANTTTLQNAYEASVNSTGDAQKLAGDKINTLASDLQRLRDTIQKVAYDSSTGALGKMFGDVIVGLNDLINGLEQLPPAVGVVSMVFVGLLVAGKAFTSLAGTIHNTVSLISNGMKFWQGAMSSAAGGLVSLSSNTAVYTADLNANIFATEAEITAEEAQVGAMEQTIAVIDEKTGALAGATDATEAQTVASGGLDAALIVEQGEIEATTAAWTALDIASGGIALAIGVVVTGLALLATHLGATTVAAQGTQSAVQDFSNSLQQQTQQAQSNASQLVQNINQLQMLKSQYDKVKQSLDTATKGSAQYQQAQQQMVEIERQLINIVGQRAASQILSSKDVVGSINNEIKAMVQLDIESNKQTVDKMQQEDMQTQFTIAATTLRIKAYQAEINALGALSQQRANQVGVSHAMQDMVASQSMSASATATQDKNAISALSAQNKASWQKFNASVIAENSINNTIANEQAVLKELQANPNVQFNNLPNPYGNPINSAVPSNFGMTSKKAKSTKAAATAPSTNLVSADTNVLANWTQKLDTASATLTSTNDALSTANSAFKSNASSVSAMSDVMSAYNDDMSALHAHQKLLYGDTWQINQLLPGLRSQLANVSAEYKSGKLTTAEYQSATKTLNDEITKLTANLGTNAKSIAADSKSMASATASLTSDMVASLKQSYTDQQNMEQQALSNIYQPQIDSLNAQKTAIDSVISSLTQQWAIQDANTKLAQDQADLATVMADTQYRIVNANGTVSLTYDTTKAQSIQQKIVSDQHTIEKNQLEQQKSAIDAQLAQVKAEYASKKSALDNYWKYKLSSDQLNTTVDNLIAKVGLKNAAADIASFSHTAVGYYNAVTQARLAALGIGGQSIAQSLGGAGISSSGNALNAYWQNLKNKGGMWVQGMSLSQIASQYGSSAGVQTNSNGHDFIPWSDISAHAYTQSNISTPSGVNVGGISGGTTTTVITKSAPISIQTLNASNPADVNALIDQINASLGG